MIVASQVSARLTVRMGPRPVLAGGLALVGASMALLSLADAGSGYGLIAASLTGMGFGMGLAMTPATESLMSSLPREQAGVGSAMNDTVRQVGGALGVAILGSLLSSGYRGDMDAAVSALPADAGHTASEGVGGAMAVAHQIGGPAGDSLAATAQHAFTNAMGTTALIAAAAALIGSLFAARLLPGKDRDEAARPVTAEAAEPVAA
jgi:MFS family permease